jgi:uncharacterized cupin superfamily protein
MKTSMGCCLTTISWLMTMRFLLVSTFLCCRMVHAFAPRRPTTVIRSRMVSSFQQQHQRTIAELSSRCLATNPAVEGWPEKYTGTAGGGIGPRVLHQQFAVHEASGYYSVEKLDVANWPTWTTAGKPKWDLGNQVVDKIMPYGELSYVLSGKLEIIPTSTGEPVIVKPGDFVTFPEGFQASWKVLEELTWHYYLY